MKIKTLLLIYSFAVFCRIPNLMSAIDVTDGIAYEFYRIDSCYSLRGSFIIEADYDCVTEILYDFKHLKYIIATADSITLLQQGTNWYEVSYTFKKFLYTNRSIYRKTFKPAEQKIVFELLSDQQNTHILPKLLSSTGYYQIKPVTTGYQIEYYQQVIVKSTFFKDRILNMAKKEFVNFMLNLREYLNKQCPYPHDPIE